MFSKNIRTNKSITNTVLTIMFLSYFVEDWPATFGASPTFIWDLAGINLSPTYTYATLQLFVL
jgi:hypothetical protein